MADSQRRSSESSSFGSMLVALGCLGVLAATFAVGFYTGRYWTRSALLASAREGTSSGAESPGRGNAPARPTPALTFYEELTAPLAPSAPPAKAAPPEARRPAERVPTSTPHPDDRPARVDRRTSEGPPRPSEMATSSPQRLSEAATPSPRPSLAASPGSRFTVQIAAYSAKESAEALRDTVSATGHEAYIVESDGPPGAPRYRVRIGSYPSREAAVTAAARLSVPGGRYVTTR
jgi:DedD protein